jgi:hypothetical protein
MKVNNETAQKSGIRNAKDVRLCVDMPKKIKKRDDDTRKRLRSC